MNTGAATDVTGLANRLRERAPLPTFWSQDVVFCTSPAGRELSRFTGVLGLAPNGDLFPEIGQQAPQYLLEELPREAVDEFPSRRLVLGSRVVAAEQDDEPVTVTVEDDSGQRSVVTADYVIGCDGPRSVVREQIGSRYTGEQALRPNFGIVVPMPAPTLKAMDYSREIPGRSPRPPSGRAARCWRRAMTRPLNVAAQNSRVERR